MKWVVFTVTVVLLASWAKAKSPAENLRAVSNEYAEWKMSEFPEVATFRGRHEYDDRLSDISTTAHDRRKTRCEEFLRRVRAIDKRRLNSDDLNNYEVLEMELAQYIDGHQWREYGPLNPMSFLGGIQRPPSWIQRMLFHNRSNFDTYVRRMDAHVKKIGTVRSLMDRAIQLNRTNHYVSMKTVPEQIVRIMQPANESVFYWPYANALQNSTVPPAEWAALINAGVAKINEINQAYQQLLTFVNKTYMTRTRPKHGVGSLDNGRAYYDACLKFYLSESMTAEQIRDIGLSEVARIKAEMEKIMRRENFGGTLPEFFVHLRTVRRKEFYDMTADQLFNEYRHITYNRINPRVPMVIKNDPGVPVKIKPMPYDGPPALYGSNTYWVNLRRPHTRPSFTMMALSIHEANPGHHLQITYAQRLPIFQFRQIGTTLGHSSGPLNFPRHTIYIEGWGLYAEFLGEEMGLYNTGRLEMFGRYSWEMIRACRLVVDTGIHAFGMTREWAIDYMANHTAMPRQQIALEVERYITWPGQACAYKIGELEFKRQRSRATSALRGRFDVRNFHKAVLDTGSVPMPVVARAVDAYIRQNSGATKPKVGLAAMLLAILGIMRSMC